MPTPTLPRRPIGMVDDHQYGTLVADVYEYIGDLTHPASVAVYGQMRRDSKLAAVLAGWTLQLRRASWQLDGAGCRPEVVQQVADDLGIPVMGQDRATGARLRNVSWNEHLRTALLHLTWGHFGHELVAEVVDGRARLSALAERMPGSISAIHADPGTGRLLGVDQMMVGSKSPQIPADRLVWYVHEREGNNWAGTSLLRPAYAPWLIKREMMRVNAISNRRWGAGVPVAVPAAGITPTAAQIAEAQKLASAARAGDQAGAAMPAGFDLKIVGLSGAVPDTLGFIKWLDQQMTSAALMSHLDLGGETSHGSQSLGRAFIDLLMMALESTAEHVASTCSREVVARIVGWNWGENEPVPGIAVSGIGSQREVTAESLNMLLQSGALSADPGLEQWVRREYRLPERESSDAPTGRAYEFDIANGVVTPNERRAQIGLPPVEGGDVLRDPNAPAPAPVAPPKPAPEPAPAVAASAKRKPRSQASGQLALPVVAAAASDEDQAAAVQAAWSAAVAALLAQWPALSLPLVDALTAQAVAAVTSGDVAALGSLAAPADVVDKLSAALTESMTALAVDAAAQVVAEAAARGVSIATVEPDASQLTGLAMVVASLIASGYATAAARKALQVGPDGVEDAVRSVLVGMSAAASGWVADNVGAALSQAQNAGRAAVFEAHPPTALRASEVNDKAECQACREVDGTAYPTLADALEDYPNGGQYKSCEGGLRCRGMLIPIW